MKKKTMRIEIVSSTMPGLSSMGNRSRNSIFSVLSRHYTDVTITLINDLNDLDNLVARKPDLVFLGMKFIPCNPLLGFHDRDKIWIADYLEMHGIASTGSSHKAHKLELNKHLAKQQAEDAGLNTAKFFVAKRGCLISETEFDLAYPVFVKPSNRGGGLGVDSDSVVNNFQELLIKVASISCQYEADALIEEFLPGKEYSIAILKNQDDDYSVMPIELIAEKDTNGSRMLSKVVKTSNRETVLAVSNAVIWATVTTLALDVFKSLGARDYGRIDVRMDSAGVPHFLEANLIPSLIDGYGSFPKACQLNQKLGYESMILRITSLGLLRNINEPSQADEPRNPVLVPELFDIQPAF